MLNNTVQLTFVSWGCHMKHKKRAISERGELFAYYDINTVDEEMRTKSIKYLKLQNITVSQADRIVLVE